MSSRPKKSYQKRSKAKSEEPPPAPAESQIDFGALRRRFDEFDKDGSGFLEMAEAKAALTKLGSKLSFEELDKDGDARISFEEFTVLTSLMGTYSHPIFKGAQTKSHATGISVFAGEAHLNEAFMNSASSAWRKLGETARAKGFTRAQLKKCFDEIDIDMSGHLDHGEVRLAIKRMAPQLTEVDITLMLACADKDADEKITIDEFSKMMLHDSENDVPYWEKYGSRDMHTSGKLANPWL